MTFRQRVAVAAAAAVAIALLAAAAAAYLAVGFKLEADFDQGLREWAEATVVRVAGTADTPTGVILTPGQDPAAPPVATAAPTQDPSAPEGGDNESPVTLLPASRPTFGGPPTYYQLVGPDGPIAVGGTTGALPVTALDRAIAAGERSEGAWETTIQGVRLRGYTQRIGPRLALQVARPLTAVTETMRGLAWILGIVTFLGICLGGLLAWLVSRRALRPVVRLTQATEDIAAAEDLSRRVDEPGQDEIGRLAQTFNSTLARLERSAHAQQRLVADASHELRTPLASLRANVELLAAYDDIPAGERQELLADVVTQSEELTTLIADIIHAGERTVPADAMNPVDLDALVAAGVARARRLAPQARISAHLDPTVVIGDPERLARLVANLLDNAIKYGALGAGPDHIEVTLANHTLTVRDHGPGFTPEEIPHVCERFYRSHSTMGLPGSGLGLAIVAQVASAHGAHVRVRNATDGGAMVAVEFIPAE